MIQTAQPIPEHLDVLPEVHGIVIRRRWFSWTILALALFAIVWDCFLFFWYFTAMHSKGGIEWLAILFPIGHVAVGIGITYYVLCGFLNKTDIKISPAGLEIKTHPLPWKGNKILNASDIVSVSTRMKHRSYNRNTGPSFEVMYVDPNNRLKTLVGGLSEPEQAEFIAREIQARLNKPGNA